MMPAQNAAVVSLGDVNTPWNVSKTDNAHRQKQTRIMHQQTGSCHATTSKQTLINIVILSRR